MRSAPIAALSVRVRRGDGGPFVLYHVGDLYLLVVGIPLVALGRARVRRRSWPRGRCRCASLSAVSLATAFWLPLQVGVFASRYVGHLAERDLIVVAPPLFVCLAVWLARGIPRPQPSTSIIAFAIAVPAVLLPVGTLVTPYAAPGRVHDPCRFTRLLEGTSARFVEVSWMLFAVLLVAVAVTIPRRAVSRSFPCSSEPVSMPPLLSSLRDREARAHRQRPLLRRRRANLGERRRRRAGHLPLRRQHVLERRLEDGVLERSDSTSRAVPRPAARVSSRRCRSCRGSTVHSSPRKDGSIGAARSSPRPRSRSSANLWPRSRR